MRSPASAQISLPRRDGLTIGRKPVDPGELRELEVAIQSVGLTVERLLLRVGTLAGRADVFQGMGAEAALDKAVGQVLELAGPALDRVGSERTRKAVAVLIEMAAVAILGKRLGIEPGPGRRTPG